MEITGTLLTILPETRGESQRGPWVRGGFVIETGGEYPRKVAFTTFGEERLAMIKSIALNTPVIVNFNPESREYEGRWYTDLRCTRVQTYVPGQMPPQTQGYGAWPPAPPAGMMGAPTGMPSGVVQQPAPAAPGQAAAPSQPSQPFAAPLSPEEDLPF